MATVKHITPDNPRVEIPETIRQHLKHWAELNGGTESITERTGLSAKSLSAYATGYRTRCSSHTLDSIVCFFGLIGEIDVWTGQELIDA